MAGDIGIDEKIILIPPQPPAMASAVAETASQEGARIIHRYGPRVMIAEVPEQRMEDVRAAVPAGEITAAPQELPLPTTENLDPIGALGLAAFSLRQSPQYIAAKAQRPHNNVQWDGGGTLLPPDPPPQHGHLMRSPESVGAEVAAVWGTTSQQMTGSIAVGIIIISGPTADLQFSQAETLQVIAEVQNGLGWLASQNHPANITWNYDIHSVQVNVQPGGGGDRETLWRDPTMVALGFQGNWQGVSDYINHIRTMYNTQWTYVAFFTKYPLDHFAYASIGGPRLVMQYANDGWGPDNIDRVFAHETGHIFQAPDEYSSSGCDCGGSWGIYNQPNGNCQLCAPGGGVDCIMRSNSWAICHWTPLHFGFPIISERPYVFDKGGDGNLWVHWWSGSEWHWSNQGRPSGVTLSTSVDAITVDGGRPYVFVKGSDGNLWVHWWSGSEWHWSNQGRPSGVTLSTSLAAITVDNGRPYVFVKGSDGNLWVHWWSGSEWHWSNQERPSGVTLSTSVDAITIEGA